MQRLGIVDLGSGTSRLVVYLYEPGKHFRLVDEIREPVRLGEGLASNNRLSKAGMERALSALKMYDDFARATELEELRVIATSAARDAQNGPEFLSRVRKLGLDVRILSGEDEARYGVLAVANSFAYEEAWVMDLGGGSAQLSRMQGRQYRFGQAYPLGGVRLTEMFLKSDPPKKGEVEDLERFVRKEMKAILQGVRTAHTGHAGNLEGVRVAHTRYASNLEGMPGHAGNLEGVREKPLPLIAMGGTVRNLAKLVQKRKNYPLDMVHGYFLSRDDLEDLLSDMLKISTPERRELEGLQADRADVIVAGGLVYRTVLRETGQKGIWISGQGVREGVFYEAFLPEPHLVQDVRGFSVRNLFARYAQPYGHTARVRHFCRLLFRALTPLHSYGAEEEQLLDEAALLHDIGMNIAYYDHHKHSEYLVMGSALPGLTHREQVLLGLLVRYHRKGEPKVGSYKSLLEDGDAKRLLRLAAILRLTEYLERSRAGRVESLEVELEAKQVRLLLHAEEEPWVELAEASKQGKLFQQAFGRELVVQWER